MSVKLITEGIWDEITLAVKKSKIKSFVAVAYFGQNGAEMLPLNEGSVLLVDASEKAVKSGQTSPNELLKLYFIIQKVSNCTLPIATILLKPVLILD